MKRLLTTILLALIVMVGQAKDVVWEQPTIEYGNSNGDGFFNLALDVTKVELKDNETVVYITALQRSDSESRGAALYHHFCRWHRTQQVCTDKQGLQAGYGVPFPAVA